MSTNLLLPESAVVLVAILPKPQDLEIARLLGWYRIPARFAPKVVHVDYLAFYQPSSFGIEHDARIEYICEVRGVELVTRRELFSDQPEHPRAEEEYYKIQIGSLKKLPNPILSGKWKRLTFLYTTGERISLAKELKDLVIHDDERKVFWRSLRERVESPNAYNNTGSTDTQIDLDFIPVIDDLFDLLESGDW